MSPVPRMQLNDENETFHSMKFILTKEKEQLINASNNPKALIQTFQCNKTKTNLSFY